MTQHERILEYLARFGTITPMQAFSDLGITKLATRISEMSKLGVEFESRMVTGKNRFGETVRYMEYRRI